jgi:hypothetical protein
VELSSSGTVMLAGAPDAEDGEGAVYLFGRSGKRWSFEQAIVGSFGAGSWFGISLALSANGRVALVGAPLAGSGGPVGLAALYTESRGHWSLSQILHSVAGRGADFGQAVALSANGSVALVGAPYAGSPGGSPAGLAQLYLKAGGHFVAAQRLGGQAGAGGAFGFSVARTPRGGGGWVGAPTPPPRDGAVELYRTAGGRWSPAGSVRAPLGSGGELGLSVALSADGRRAVAGAPLAGRGDGAVWFFERTGLSWEVAGSASGGPGSSEHLGVSVALAAGGGRAMAGAPEASSGRGSFVVYLASGAGWTAAQHWSGDAGSAAHLGTAVALSGDGDAALAGAPGFAG